MDAEARRDYILTHDREVILLRERYEKAGKELLFYGIGVLACAVFLFGWMQFYWSNIFIHAVMIGGPWCTAMLLVNLIRRVTLKRRIAKLVTERSS